MNDKQLFIDESFKRLICPLSIKEYKKLERSIISEGCKEPILIWNNTIIDGHNRYKICTNHNISYSITEMEFECKEAVMAWICANQLKRNNITEETRKFLIGMQYENEKIVTRLKNKTYKTQGYNIHEDSSDPNKPLFAQIIANENNIAVATVQKYAIFTRALEKIGSKEPKLIPKILSGQYKISHKNTIEMAELPAEDLQRINRKIDRNPGEYIQYRTTRKSNHFGKYEAIPTNELLGPSVKDMPAFDPDAEVKSLSLTIPSWQSSIERTKKSADFSIISPTAKKSLVKALHSISLTIVDLLLELEGKTNG